MTEKIKEQYNKVFDEYGNVKNCGREECKKLICLCKNATTEKIDFGNEDTGFMNIDNIKNFVNKMA